MRLFNFDQRLLAPNAPSIFFPYAIVDQKGYLIQGFNSTFPLRLILSAVRDELTSKEFSDI